MTYDKKELGEVLEECKEVNDVKEKPHGLEVRVELVNPDWGLPSDVYKPINNSTLHIVDISGISKESITIYIE